MENNNKIKKTKGNARIPSLFIFAAILVLQLSACSDAAVNDTVTTQSELKETGTTEITTTWLDYNLPNSDYEGAAFNIIAGAEESKELYFVESETGEVLDDAVYKRNLTIEERFNVNLNYSFETALSDGMTAFHKKLTNSITAGDSEYDLVISLPDITSLVVKGYFKNLNSLPYLDFEQPWWFTEANRNLSILGKLYTTAGTYSVYSLKDSWAVAFNKKVAENYNIESIYDNVNNNKWTVDKLLELGRLATSDLDGDGNHDENDAWGLLAGSLAQQNIPYCTGIRHITMDGDGFPSLVGASERTVNIFDKLYNLFINSGICFGGNNNLLIFTSDNALFFMTTLWALDSMRDVEDFGIVPIPKADELQETYLSTNEPELFLIPISVRDEEMSALILEGLNAESYRTVNPVYYDTVLSRKYARDEDSLEMLDIIFGNITSDIIMLYRMGIDPFYNVFRTDIIFNSGSFDYVSFWSKNESTVQRSLDKLVQQYDEMD